MYTTPIAFLLLFIVATQCSHFRGGSITWTTSSNSRDVSFKVTTYWNVSFVPEELTLEFGDGNDFKATTFEITKVQDYTTLSFTTKHTYAEDGTYTASFVECCRVEFLKGGAAGETNRMQAEIVVDDLYRQSPVIQIPPIVKFKIGYNFLELQSSLPVQSWEFTNPSVSGLPYSYTTGTFEAVNTPVIEPTGPKSASLQWTADESETGTWAVSVFIVTADGKYTIDFLLTVLPEYTIPNPPYIEITPPTKHYGLTDGQSTSFTVVCPHTDDSVKYELVTPQAYPGLTFDGKPPAPYAVDANIPVAVSYTPKPDYSYADNIQYPITLYCREKDNGYATYATVVVSVGKPLVLTPPPSTTVDCVSPCKCLNVTGTATYTDGCCGVAKVWYTDVFPENSCNTQVVRTWYATNDCGQSDTKNQIIYVRDQTPPQFTATGFGDLTLQCPVIPPGTPTARDTCSSVNITSTITPPLSSACVQTLVRKFTATDRCGNNATLNQNIRIQDTTKPTLFKTVESTFSYRRDCPYQSTAFDGIVRGSDNCGKPVNITFVDVNRPPCGKFTRVFTGADTCNNKATLSIDLEISHGNKPTINISPNYGKYQCPADTSSSPRPTATSFCGDSLPVNLDKEVVTRDYRNCAVKATRTWSAKDACDNVGTANEEITLDDKTPPALCIPADITVECVYGAACAYTPCSDFYHPNKTGSAHATDACGENVTITWSDKFIPGDCRYTITSDRINRTWTATDACGNSISKSQYIIIKDTKVPEFCPPPDFYGQCPADIKRAAGPKDFSDCKKVTANYSDSTIYQAYLPCGNFLKKRTWVISDECGNSVDYVQLLNISDTIPPNITVPCDAVVECRPKADNITATGRASGTDNCKMSETASHRIVLETPDYLIREWTVYDACGNSRKGNQTIKFNNSIPDITCPPDITVECSDLSYPNVTGCATANDLCTGTIIPYHSDSESGTCPRTITRTWYAFNPITSKSSSCQQIIKIWHDEGPHLKVPPDSAVQCKFQATIDNTGSACTGQFCLDEEVYGPTSKDDFFGTPCRSDFELKRTWSAHDNCSRVTTGVQTVTIFDTVPPVITVPPQCTVTCRLNISTQLCGYAHVSDNCDADYNPTPVLSYDDSLVASKYSCPSTVQRVWTASDCTGNKARDEQAIYINEAAPVFDSYLPKTLPPVECLECITFNKIYATGACNELIEAVPTITKDGICPTTVTITWVARDDCGRESTFVQTMLVEDKTDPELDVQYATDIEVECDAYIPTYGIVQARDNCALVGKPTFTDKFVPGNCTCDSCTKILERTWTVKDRCGRTSKPYIQRIISAKKNYPTITLPVVDTIPCGTSYTADEDGTGYATAKDSCGSPLFVTYVDNRTTNADGTIQINRRWSTSDSCGHYVESDQIIKVQATTSDYGYVFTVPPARYLQCRGNIHADEAAFPEYNAPSDYTSDLYASSPCGDIRVTNSMDATCSLATQGTYVRTWNAVLNGQVFESKKQYIYVSDCPSYGAGISGLPTAPVAVSNGIPASVTPSFTIYDLDIPCDSFTVMWTFGTGSPVSYVCTPQGTNPLCKFDEYKSSLTVSAGHNYTSAGVYKVTVRVSGKRSKGSNDAYAQGTVVTADRYTGTISGCAELDYTNDDIVPTPPLYGGYAPQYTCLKPWIIKTSSDYSDKYTDAQCAGRPKLDFSASFLPSDNGAYGVKGSVVLTWSTCAGGLVFNGTVEHLAVFGKSALVTGKATYNKGSGILLFSLYVVDSGKTGDALHFRVTTSAGIVVFDTDPCMPEISDYKTQPISDPVNYVDPTESSVSVYTPTSEQVAALNSETPVPTPGGEPVVQTGPSGAPSSSVGTIVGIVVGIMVFVVVVAIIVFFLLKQQQGKTTSTASSYSMSM